MKKRTANEKLRMTEADNASKYQTIKPSSNGQLERMGEGGPERWGFPFCTISITPQISF
jgi:hypothetical protein